VDSVPAGPDVDGTTVRVVNGKTEVLDGPYAEPRSNFGRYYMVEVPDLDAPLLAARLRPVASHGRSRSARSGGLASRCRPETDQHPGPGSAA